MELNPNHPVTRSMSDQWHKLAAVLVHKAGGHAVITSADLYALGHDCNIVIQELADGIHLTIVDGKTAAAMVSREGGLPC